MHWLVHTQVLVCFSHQKRLHMNMVAEWGWYVKGKGKASQVLWSYWAAHQNQPCSFETVEMPRVYSKLQHRNLQEGQAGDARVISPFLRHDYSCYLKAEELFSLWCSRKAAPPETAWEETVLGFGAKSILSVLSLFLGDYSVCFDLHDRQDSKMIPMVPLALLCPGA